MKSLLAGGLGGVTAILFKTFKIIREEGETTAPSDSYWIGMKSTLSSLTKIIHCLV